LNRRSIIWVDSQGRTRQTLLTGNAPGGGLSLANVEAQLLLLSNADWQTDFEGALGVNGAPAPVAAQYPTVSDYAALVYTDAVGSLTYLTLPAPQAGIFLADGETVNPAALAALNAAVIGEILTSGGGAVTAYISGVRRKILKEYQ
jgi:hypothetical protein